MMIMINCKKSQEKYGIKSDHQNQQKSAHTDQVNNANSAFIFLINLLIGQGCGSLGQGGHGGPGGHGGQSSQGGPGGHGGQSGPGGPDGLGGQGGQP